MHPQKVTVWCGFRASGVICPYFFENDINGVTIPNCKHYKSMKINCYGPQLNNIEGDNI